MQPKRTLAAHRRLGWVLLLGIFLTNIPESPAAGGNSDAMRAIDLCKQGKEREALPFFERAIRRAPGDEQLLYNRALAYQSLGEIDKSIADYSACLRLAPLNSKVYYKRALAYMSKNDYSRAKRDLDRVIVIDHKNADAFLSRGNIYFAVEKYQDALRDFDKSLELLPSAQAYINKGNAEQRLGLSQQAALEYAEAIKLDTNAMKAIFERSMLYLCQGKYPIAIRDANKYIEIRGWTDEGSAYASFLKLFAAKLSKDKDTEKKTIFELSDYRHGDKWSQAIAAFLVGKKDEKQLFATAGTDNDRLTEAHTYIAMKQYCEGKTKEAKLHFNWVLQNGNKLFDEFTLAKSLSKKIQ